MRDRLISLLDKIQDFGEVETEFTTHIRTNDRIADHLLANGVILPPCKVGDTVYHLQRVLDDATLLIRVVIKKRKVDFASTTNSRFAIEADGFIFNECDFGKTVFLTREEAEKALKERSEQ